MYYKCTKPVVYDPEQKTYIPVPCRCPEHNPPMLLYIPPGETRTHICPSCGKKFVMYMIGEVIILTKIS